MEVADLVLPVFAVIVTGWLAGWLGYISRTLADGLVYFERCPFSAVNASTRKTDKRRKGITSPH